MSLYRIKRKHDEESEEKIKKSCIEESELREEDPDFEFVLQQVPHKEQRIKGVSYLLNGEVRIWNGHDFNCEHNIRKAECRYCRPDRVQKCGFKDCQFSTAISNNMKNHKRIHTKEKPFQCKFQGCNRTFSQFGTMQIHTRTHTGEKCICVIWIKSNNKIHTQVINHTFVTIKDVTMHVRLPVVCKLTQGHTLVINLTYAVTMNVSLRAQLLAACKHIFEHTPVKNHTNVTIRNVNMHAQVPVAWKVIFEFILAKSRLCVISLDVNTHVHLPVV